ncbi:putative bifunctional diguanylate cyclase/phosphodiesterase [Denitromonas iodatirespirans]|uniref:Bifunctional diguanylate cyclase/phosphodiesterase n=1 Tax=Denitromonas iodatirespirans TaxID=2795389 RepID=A0A944D6W3_DENI1|nr:bifunctional diguanylate cyclase/phosphodiesterase [Denitromonas iodatirespirans]MBT0960935.1 bifunctional diguanylate cyclase/phosphodiesterase [Denitromonas iodatirespirans]
MSIRLFILLTSAVVGLVFVGGSWYAVTSGFEETLARHARNQAEESARLTQAMLYEVMNTGWYPEQAQAFNAALRASNPDMTIRIHNAAAPGATPADRASDPLLREVLESGAVREQTVKGNLRSVFPLVAEARCLSCHNLAQEGQVLGAIEVRTPLAQVVAEALWAFFFSAMPSILLGIGIASGGVWWVSRRIGRSVEAVEEQVDAISSVADLKALSNPAEQPFAEIARIQQALGTLAMRLRSIAVDKDILLFEIGLLEKFVITSEVIRDWREYVNQLLTDINAVIDVHVLFSVFQIGDEAFEVEVFWHGRPDDALRSQIEAQIAEAVKDHPRLSGPAEITLRHHHDSDAALSTALDAAELALRIKSLFVEQPKIGGIVGIGVHADTLADQTHMLVLESILSTLLNVVGSIKAIHKYTRDLEYYATRDPLTGLYNQRVFWELLGYEVGRSQRHASPFTLLLLDLDNFKLINDHYGHACGDRFLQQFSGAVAAALRPGDIFARYGGDEFVVVLPEADMEQGYTVAQRVLDVARGVEIEAKNGDRIHASASIGVAVFPDHAADPKDLFLFADTMMYRAKAEGKERVRLPTNADVMTVFRDLSEMGVAVLAAVEEKRITPYFQPILGIADKQVAAVEVLSRIEINGEVIRADQFIEIAEKVGVIHRLDAIVIEAALAKVAGTDYDGYLFFNLSPRALVLSEFTTTLRTIVAASGFPPERIVFEITERDTVKNLSLLQRFLSELRAEGFKLAIDDFGSGFSSFHYLRNFTFDFLKIEGDFVANMLSSERDQVFVRSITALARQLDIKVIAEFVENAEILALLDEIGIDYAQGYLIGRPTQEAPGTRLALCTR